MWQVLPWLNIMVAWYAAEAFDSEPFHEYSFSRRNGIPHIEPLALPIYKEAVNATHMDKHIHLLNASDYDPLRRQYYEQQTFGQSSEYKRVRRAGQIKEVLNQDKALSLLQGSAKEEELNECVHEKVIMVDCNNCVCMGGQLYICTSRICKQKDELQVHPQAEYRRGGELQKYSQVCIEGQEIRSFDRCNKCYCGGGQVLCTTMKCLVEPGKKHKECTPGDHIPSPDGCNSCDCNARGEVVCTAKTCGPQLSTTIKGKVCVPNTWYSMSDNKKCKECYCVNGKIAFCFMKLCVDENKSQRVVLKNAIQSVPGMLPDKCRKLDYVQDKCTRCYCNEALTWICRTKDSEHCIGKVPNPWEDSASDSYEEWSAKRPKRPKTTKRPIRPKTTKRPKKPTRPIKPTKSRKPFKPTRPERYTKITKTPNRWKTTFPPNYYDESTRKATKKPYYPEEKNVPPIPDYDYVEPPRLTTNNPEIIYRPTEEQYFPSEDPYIQPSEIPNDSQTAQHPWDFQPEYFDEHSVTVEPLPSIPTIPPTPNGKGTLDTNVDRGPFCLTGQYISQSSNNTCQSCLCTSLNEWKCWSVKGACQSYTESSCTPGRLKKNSNSLCSVCYCGADSTSYCATDEACAFFLKPSNCEAVACMDQCAASMANFGICHRDKCVCIQ